MRHISNVILCISEFSIRIAFDVEGVVKIIKIGNMRVFK